MEIKNQNTVFLVGDEETVYAVCTNLDIALAARHMIEESYGTTGLGIEEIEVDATGPWRRHIR